MGKDRLMEERESHPAIDEEDSYDSLDEDLEPDFEADESEEE